MKVLTKYPTQSDYELVFEDKQYIKAEMITQMTPKDRIVKTYITTIDLTSKIGVPENSLGSVKVNFYKNDDYWKSGWLIEGFVLEPEYSDNYIKEHNSIINPVEEEEKKELKP